MRSAVLMVSPSMARLMVMRREKNKDRSGEVEEDENQTQHERAKAGRAGQSLQACSGAGRHGCCST
jgi:hypothetical protein